MKQILQDINKGETYLIEAPAPSVSPGNVLIRSVASLVSTGTERMLVEFGKANLLQKARQQPEKVKEVIDKAKTDGLAATYEAVRDKLNQPIPLGYCNAGTVIEVGKDVTEFEPGDRVISNGPHAEVVSVPENLCARIPDKLFESFGEEDAFERAAFTVAGAIALQSIRLAKPTLGETFAVTGLGLIGLLAVQILKANGCRVVAIDPNEERVRLAEEFGAKGVRIGDGTDPVAAAAEATSGCGVDGVIIAAATKSSEPVHQAAQMCRKRGRIVLVGVTGLELQRSDFYEKELSFQVSCSYGPGRYDVNYEDKGLDYPIGYVRWTEQRNFQAVLGLMSDGRLDPAPLVSTRRKLEDAPALYSEMAEGSDHIGALITYPRSKQVFQTRVDVGKGSDEKGEARARGKGVAGVIGAGNFAMRTILPLLCDSGFTPKTICSRGGTNAAIAAKKFGFAEAASDADAVFENDEIDTVFVLTPHTSHTGLISRALDAGKHVFTEKPLAISQEQLDEVIEAHDRNRGKRLQLHVGFNRRFAPLVKKIKWLLRSRSGPKTMMMHINAGQIDANHWIQDPEVGGGRIIGEACHFVDLLRYLVGAPIADSKSVIMDSDTKDTASITLKFEDGSIGVVNYWANGSKAYPKERLEVFSGGGILVLDNFRRLSGCGWPGFKRKKMRRQDKGHAAQVQAFAEAVMQGKGPLIPFEEMVEVAETTIKAVDG